MKQALVARDDGLRTDGVVLSDLPALALVELVPVGRGAGLGLPVDLAVEVAIDVAAAFAALGRRDHRLGLAGARIERDDLAGRVADAEIDPPRIVGGNEPLILGPVLLMDVAVVLELARPRVERHDAAVRIGDRPDDARIVLGHAHGHLRGRLVREREGPRCRIELAEVAAKVRVEPAGA